MGKASVSVRNLAAGHEEAELCVFGSRSFTAYRVWLQVPISNKTKLYLQSSVYISALSMKIYRVFCDFQDLDPL